MHQHSRLLRVPVPLRLQVVPLRARLSGRGRVRGEVRDLQEREVQQHSGQLPVRLR